MAAPTTQSQPTAPASAHQPAHRWTYAELEARQDEARLEIHDGELIEMASPNIQHQEILFRLALTLRLFAQESSLGRVYLSPLDLYISETMVFIPDIIFVRRERYAQERIQREDGACLVAPPDLVVEILSNSTARYDRNFKFDTYANFGVQHYWIIDPVANAIEAYTLQDQQYAAEVILSGAAVFEPSLFPGLKIPLAELFAPA